MPKEKLRELIASLHAELQSADSLDDGSRAMLAQLMQDVEELAGSDAATAERQDSASGRLESAALKFEADYPKLSMTLGEIMDALGKLGI